MVKDPTTNGAVIRAWHGQALHLLPERAIWWPARRTLIVADVHLGKGAALRRQGVAVPHGVSAADLDRLSALISRHALQRLLMLGDVFHARPGADEPMMAAFDHFRDRHPALDIAIVRGNHDRPAALPAAWQLRWLAEGTREPPFVWRHTPGVDARGAVMAGHVHPAHVLRVGAERARVPVYWWQPQQLVLPAFGGLTGGFVITPATADRLYAVVPDAVIPLPSRARLR